MTRGKFMDYLKRFLKNHEITLDDLSTVSGISKDEYLHSFESGLDEVNIRLLKGLATATATKITSVVEELALFSGNSIMNFIEMHPDLDSDLVKMTENLMIDLYQNNISLESVTFNRYYSEGEDTDERAEQMLRNLCTFFLDLLKNVDDFE